MSTEKDISNPGVMGVGVASGVDVDVAPAGSDAPALVFCGEAGFPPGFEDPDVVCSIETLL